MMNCTKGVIDDSNFGKPMPIIGLYIAGATWLCIIAMIMDLVEGIRSTQFWIPSNYFSTNAASLTVVGIAIKLSVDLNSPMPSQVDQLAKLATSAFICTVLVNIPPSLVRLMQSELLANKIALAFLVITSIVNLCMQLKTGVIHEFGGAHILVIFMMSLFWYKCHSLTVEYHSDKRSYFVSKFEKLHQQALEELRDDISENKKESTKVKEYLRKFSMMAQSGCPQLQFVRSPPSMALAQYSLIPASAFYFVLFASITHNDKMVDLNTCSGKSDYGWSVLAILITQGIAVVLGLVTPFCRMIYAWKARSHRVRGTNPQRNESLQEEKHFWMKDVHKIKRYVVFPYIEHKYRSPTVYFMKMILYKLIFTFQYFFFHLYLFLPPLWVIVTNREPNDYSPYYLHMPYEKNYLAYMVKSSSRVTHKYLFDGKKEEPKLLIAFLGNYLSHDFGGVLSFESDQVPPLSERHPANCWALPVLTLTCIATALPNIDPTSKEQLRMCVNEGLIYVKLVEDNLNATDDLSNIRYAAYILWKGLNRPKHRWLSADLENLARNRKCPTEVLSLLAESAEKMFLDYMSFSDREHRRICLWTTMGINTAKRYICPAVAAHSMYKICQTTLQDCQNENSLNPSSHDIFEELRKAIVDILGACFTNLRQCILLECKRSTMESRRETALRMLKVFGETEKIMDILEEKAMKIPLSDDKMSFIDEWRLYLTHHRDGL